MQQLLLLLALMSLPALGAEGNLLAGKAPVRLEGVTDVGRMTDGVAAPEGDEWKSTRTSILSANGFAIWDLGEVKPVRAGLLQGDNNDDYLLEGSLDGSSFTPLWSVHSVNEPGLHLRMIRTLDAQARFIRLSAKGGDGSFSVSEVELYSVPEQMAESTLKRQRGRSNDEVPVALWAVTLGLIALGVYSKQKALWLLGSPLLAGLLWASMTALLDRFVG